MKRKGSYKTVRNSLLVLVVMGMIFLFSAQPSTSSYKLSGLFISVFSRGVNNLPLIPKQLKELWLISPGFYVRKLAHIMIYTLLGAVTMIALYRTSLKKNWCIGLSLIICMFYAITDEWHQYFIDGRTATYKDVIIDTIGAFIGIVLVVTIKYIIKFAIKYQKKQKTLK